MMVRNFILGLIVIVFAAACSKEKPKEEVAMEAKPSATTTAVNQMPNFEITLTDGTKKGFRSESGKLLLILFNPSCDHCQRTAKLIAENRDMVKPYDMYFVSPEPLDSIAKFSYEYKLLDYNMHFGQGNGPQIVQEIGPVTEVPAFYMYENQSLIKRRDGEMKLENLRDFLK